MSTDHDLPDAAVAPDDVVIRLRAAGCVFAEEEADLLRAAARDAAHLAELVAARSQGRPLEHLVGEVTFHGGPVRVREGVFVPRRRTELLVDLALAALRTPDDDPRPPAARSPEVVVDLCCGSGALGLALRRALGRAVELHAADLDPAAVACARDNLEPIGGRVYQGDLFAALPPGLRGRVAVLLSNVPYVPTGEIAHLPPEARDHEPRTALDGGDDGLAVLRRVLAEAPTWLRPAGVLLVEVGEPQVAAAVAAVEQVGLFPSVHVDDEIGALALAARAPDADGSPPVPRGELRAR